MNDVISHRNNAARDCGRRSNKEVGNGQRGEWREEEWGMGGCSEHSQILIHSHLYLSYGQAHALPRQASRSTPHIVLYTPPPHAYLKHSLYHQAHDEAD